MVFKKMEYCDSTLEEIAKSQILSESSIIKVLKDITMGLKSLHKNKVVHLDIKPGLYLFNFVSVKLFFLYRKYIIFQRKRCL